MDIISKRIDTACYSHTLGFNLFAAEIEEKRKMMPAQFVKRIYMYIP